MQLVLSLCVFFFTAQFENSSENLSAALEFNFKACVSRKTVVFKFY